MSSEISRYSVVIQSRALHRSRERPFHIGKAALVIYSPEGACPVERSRPPTDARALEGRVVVGGEVRVGQGGGVLLGSSRAASRHRLDRVRSSRSPSRLWRRPDSGATASARAPGAGLPSPPRPAPHRRAREGEALQPEPIGDGERGVDLPGQGEVARFLPLPEPRQVKRDDAEAVIQAKRGQRSSPAPMPRSSSGGRSVSVSRKTACRMGASR
jgi:hypothetical protein